MHKKIIIILLIAIAFNCNAKNNIDKINFFDFRINQNINDVIKVLKKKNIDYRLKQNKFYKDLKVIEPKNQNLIEGLNLNFELAFYKNSVMNILKFYIEDNYIQYLENKLGDKFKKEEGDYKIVYKWEIDKTKISFSMNKMKKNLSIFEITDLQAQKKLKKNKESSMTTFYEVKIDNLRFRKKPNLTGELIRMLNKEESLELIEKGKTETVGDTTGTWVKVKTDKGEIGWCFDAYLKKYEVE